MLRPTFETLKDSGFIGGIAVIARTASRLYAAQVFGTAVSMIDPAQRKVSNEPRTLSAEPYSALVSADGQTLFVSLWGGAKVLLLEPATLEPQGEVAVGEHPNAMLQSSDGRGLFVACANTNAVWVVDLADATARPNRSASRCSRRRRRAPRRTRWRCRPTARRCSSPTPTTTPSRSSTSPRRARAAVAGFIPTGWYPTGVTFSRDGRRIYVLNGKGLSPTAEPARPAARRLRGASGQYIARDAAGRALGDRRCRTTTRWQR